VSSSRPSDHIDSRPEESGIDEPRLGLVGSLRFFWRQLTSMRTALLLLLLLAIAAVPGSLVPQVSSDPNGVIQFKAENPGITPVLEFFQVFETYSSVWFSAIYILLFVSLIGCVIPRTRHHLNALRARPPKTPARLGRLTGHTTRTVATDTETAVGEARSVLRRAGYRTERYGDSISAERGYARESGNLVFHIALLGVLVSVGLGGGFGYSGQKVIVTGSSFANVLGDYDSFNPGRFFDETRLEPYTIRLDALDVVYEEENLAAYGQPTDFTAHVTTTLRDGSQSDGDVAVNEPLSIGGTQAYLLGNGYAPVITVRDADGDVVSSEAVAFLPQDSQLTSLGIIKVPDGLDEQIGMRGFLYPTAAELDTGAYSSTHPDLRNPLLTLEVYTGDLGLDEGAAVNAYNLDVEGLTQIAGREAGADDPSAATLMLEPGETVDLPDGLGSIELESIPRFVSLDIHHDPSQVWVLISAVLALGGLITSLFIPRRRMWIRVTDAGDGSSTVEYAGLARGEDPRLTDGVAEIAERHSARFKVDA